MIMRKLNIGKKQRKERVVNLNSDEVSEKHVNAGFVFGANEIIDSNLKTSGLGESVGIYLPNEMRKLNIGKEEQEHLNSDEVSKIHGFVFGTNSKKNHGLVDVNKVPDDEMRKLNIESTGVDNSIEMSSKDANFSSKTDDKKTVPFEGSKNFDAGCMSASSENTLPDLMNKSWSGDEPDKTKYAFFKSEEKKALRFENMLPGEMNKLNIGRRTGDSGAFNGSTGGYSIPTSFTFQAGVQGKNSDVGSVPNSDSKLGEASTSSSLLPSAVYGFKSVGNTFEVPSMDRVEKKVGYSFTGSQDGYRIPDFGAAKHANMYSSMGNLASGLNKNLEFSAKKAAKDTGLKPRKGKLNQNTPVHQWLGKDYVARASSSQENPDSPVTYSPMDFSSYQETSTADQFSREASVASDGFFHSDTKCASTEAHPSVSSDATDEDLLTATKDLNINDDLKCGEPHESGSSYSFERGDGAKCPTEEFVSEAEFDCLRFTSEKMDTENDFDASVATIKTEAYYNSSTERKVGDDRTQFCFASASDNVSKDKFAFASSPSVQGNLSAQKLHCRKKNRRKVGQDSHVSSSKFQVASPCMPLFPLSGIVLQSVPGHDNLEDSSISQTKENNRSEADKKPVVNEFTSGDAATTASLEACEKWRLRGNQAYAKGNLSKAESYYTRGVNCVSPKEASKSFLKALVLCYSNRAAARMTLGRLRDALGDCKEAMAIDPNFYKVQIRAANCHLALGEIEDALRYFKKCAQSGDVCLDRKVVIEASDGLHKAQEVAGLTDRCAELLDQRKFSNAENALKLIDEALLISPYSEKLVEMKAEALFLLRRYEEVLQLCEQTLGSASLNANGQPENSDGPESMNNSRTRFWCWCLIAKSYFYLGRLEEALVFLDKLEQVGFATEKHGINSEKSLISLSVTVGELLRHKAAGNEEFQSGKYSEAGEHYTAAVSCNVESRPFAAICFCNRAAAYQAMGQITDAIADCSLAIALDGNYPKAISRRATLHEMIRDYGKAASDLQRLIDLLEKQAEDKTKESGKLGRSTSIANDLRQARSRLSTMEEESRKEIPLNMYLILGIEPSCEASDIKMAYRKAALRHHPDKAAQFLARTESGDDGLGKEIAEEVYREADRLFKIIGEAYALLSDTAKRSRYDLEEEIRNSHKKGNGNSFSSSPRRSGYPSSPYERRGSNRW